MLESVVYQVLAGYLGHYVKDIQREQFRIGLWSGEVLLENMELQLEAFDYLQLPFAIKQGSIGKLRVLIPWKKLGWEPILISLEDVTVCAGPREESEWDTEASERRELAAKKAALASAEIAKFSKCVSETKSGQSFLSNFFGKIIDNVQVVVNNVHIQYKDKKTDPEVMFFVGLTLSSLMVSTSNASFAGSAGEGKGRGSQEHKVVEIQQLALYWNPQSYPLGASLEPTDNKILSILRREGDSPDKVVHLLRPTDVTLKLLLNKNVSSEGGGAQYAVVVNVDDMVLALEDLQLRGMLLLFDAISISRAREKYGRFRPQTSEGGGEESGWQKRLWQYAIEAVLSDVRKRLWRQSLSYLVWRKVYRKRYVALYVDKLENLQHGQPSGDEESAELEAMEKQFEMDEILFFRSLAEKEMPLEDVFGNAALKSESGDGTETPTEGDLLTPEPVLQQRGWLNWLSLGMLGAADNHVTGQIFPQEIIKDLYEAAKLFPMEGGESSNGGCRVAVTLYVGELLGSLHSSKLERDILNISVQGIGVTVQMWSEKTSVSVMVRTLEAVDLCTPGNRFPRILAPWGKLTSRTSQRRPGPRSYAEALAGAGLVRSVSDGSISAFQASLAADEDAPLAELTEPLLRVDIDMQPKKHDHDLAITVILQPVEVVYSATFIERASSFFCFPPSQQVLKEQVDSAIRKLEDAALSNFKHKVVDRKRLRLQLDIRRPNFLIPENHMTTNGILMVLLHMQLGLSRPLKWDVVHPQEEGTTDCGSKKYFLTDELPNICMPIQLMHLNAGLCHHLDNAPVKGLSRAAILRRPIGGRHGIFSSKLGQNSCIQELGGQPCEKCGHYDHFELRLTGAQVLISGKIGNWHETLNNHEADLEWHLVKRFNMHVAIDICIKDDALLPRLKISGSLPALRLHFSLGKCRAVRDLLAKLLGSGGIRKGQPGAAGTEAPSYVVEGTGKVIWELNLNLKVVTVELCLDGEPRAAAREPEKKTLLAQLHDTSFKYAQRTSHEEGQVLIKTIHIEDGSELATSRLRYLLYCGACRIPTSPASLDTTTDAKASKGKPVETRPEKYSVCLNVLLGNSKGMPAVGVVVALHGLEFHIIPKVVRALHGFVLAVTTAKTTAPFAPIRSESLQTLRTIPDSENSSADANPTGENSLETQEDGHHSPGSSLPGKSSIHNQHANCSISSRTAIQNDGFGTPTAEATSSVELETEKGILFHFEHITSQLLPLFCKFQSQVAREDSTIVDIQLVGCSIQFLDLGGTVGVVLLPEATICASVPSSTSVLPKEDCWEVVVAASNLQLKGTQWASGNLQADPIGNAKCGPPATWDVTVRKLKDGSRDVLIQLRNVQVVLLADYLAGLIEYFNSSHWKSYRHSKSKVGNNKSTTCWKLEVEDSILLLPREQGKKEYVQLVLGELQFTTIEGGSSTESFCIVGQRVSVEVHDIDGTEKNINEVRKEKRNGGLILIERWDGEISIEVPPGDLPTCLEIHSATLNVTWDGDASGRQIEAFECLSRDLSTIERTRKSMVAITAGGGLNSWIPGKQQYQSKASLNKGSLSFKCCALKICVTITIADPGKVLSPRSIALLQMDSLDLDLFVNRGTLEGLALEVISIAYFQQATRLKLLQCRAGEENGSGGEPGLRLLFNSEGAASEVHISLPSTQVWLHAAAWSEVGPTIAASMYQSSTQTTTSTDSSSQDLPEQHDSFPNKPLNPLQKADLLVLQEAVPPQFPYLSHRPRSSIKQFSSHTQNGLELSLNNNRGLPTATVLVKVGKFRLAFILLDYSGEAVDVDRVHEDQEEPFAQEEPLLGKLLSCSLSLRVDEFRVNKDNTWTLAAGITEGEGNIVENLEAQEPFREMCCQATEIDVIVEGSFQQSPSVRFNMRVHADCINFWCSNPILRFFHNFTFEELQTGPPTTLNVEGRVDMRLQHASLLLSDGRWGCNAPIMELLLGSIVADMDWSLHKLDARLSSDVEASYHNMQKVSLEPLVEPWSINCTVTQMQDFSRLPNTHRRTSVRVTSAARLNINVTESLVQAASRAAEVAHDAWSDDTLAHDTTLGIYSKYAPYWLQNDTGVAITYWLVGPLSNRRSDDVGEGGLRRWGSGNGTIIEPGSSVALYVDGSPEELLIRRMNTGSLSKVGTGKLFEVLLQHRMICVQLEGTSRPSPPMSIDLVGSRSFEASFSESEIENGDSQGAVNGQGNLPRQNSSLILETDIRDRGNVFRSPVVFEVTIQRYSKLVRLCSTVAVVNMLSVPLEVRFDIPFMISPKVLEPVLPGQVRPLPVHLAQTGKIRWRPLGDGFLWSEVQPLRHLLCVPESQLRLHRPVLCYPSHRSNRPFRCCLTVNHSPIASVDSSFGEVTQELLEKGRGSAQRLKEFKVWDITLQAPLVVKNCLMRPLVVTIDTGVGAVVIHTAPEGKSIFVYDVDTVHNLSVTFQVPGFLRSSAKVVHAAHLISEPSRRFERERSVSMSENLNLFPDNLSDPVVAAEVEMVVDTVSGTREICISVPFWIYNCSYLNLAVIDGDVDVFSGRQKHLGPIAMDGASKEEEQSEMIFESTLRPGLAGLQAGDDQGVDTSYGRFPKCGLNIISQHFSSSPYKTMSLSHRRLCIGTPREEVQDKIEKIDGSGGNLVAHMYSPVKGTEASEHRLRVRVLQAEHMEPPRSVEQLWSRPFSVELPDGSTTVTIPQPHNNGSYMFSVICTPALGACAGKTKTLTFRPRFLLANACKRDLCVKQQGTDVFERLPVGQHCHLHWTDVNRDLLVSVRFNEHGWDWSGGFAPDQLGDTQVKVRNHTSGAMQMLRVEISTMTASGTGQSKGIGPGGGSLGTCLILLSDDETGFIPYRIDNFSMERLRFHQQKCEKMENILHPYSSCNYAWDEPCHPHRLVLEIPGGGSLGVYGLDDVKEYPIINLPSVSQKPERTFLISVRAEGPIRVLGIVDTALHMMRNSSEVINCDAASHGFAAPSSRDLEPDTESLEELVIELPFIGLSIIDSIPQEIIFACVKGVSLQLLQGQHQQQLKLDIGVLQVDNQLRYAVYPVMLSTTHAPQGSVRDDRVGVENDIKFLEGAVLTLAVAKWRRPAGSVDCFQCISLRLVPLRLEVEEQVVSCLLHFMENAMGSFAGGKMDKLEPSNVSSWSFLRWNHLNGAEQFASTPLTFEVIQVSTIQNKGIRFSKVVKRLEEFQCWAAAAAVEAIGGPQQKLPLLAKERPKAYIEILHISPIELTVSFSSTPWLSNKNGAATRSLLWMTGMLLQHHVMAIADAEDALVNLRQLTLAHPLASWDVIQGMISRHYTRQLLQEVYKVLGSADVLGNPIHFVRTLGSGMWDFVSTPATSFKQSPRKLARGLAQGTQSLFSNTIFAFSNAATRMSKAARKGVTAFALDKDYVARMERREHDHQGTEDLSVVNEFLEGLTGLLQSPVRGAEKAGLPGMLSGAAVGALGVVARPVATILEVASKTGQSICNRSSPVQWRATRMRLPRHLSEDSPLLPYSWESAVGRAVLLEAHSGCFRNEVLVVCMPLARGQEFVLLTQTRILKVSSMKVSYLSGFRWNMELVAAIEDILHIDRADNCVSVLLGPARREFIRGQHHSGSSHKAMCLPTHETLEFQDASAADQFLSILHFLQDRRQQGRSTLLVSTWRHAV